MANILVTDFGDFCGGVGEYLWGHDPAQPLLFRLHFKSWPGATTECLYPAPRAAARQPPHKRLAATTAGFKLCSNLTLAVL